MKTKRLKLILFFAFIGNLALTGKILAFEYQLEKPLPGLPTTVSDPASYVQYFFNFGLILAGFLAVAAIVVGGIMYMMGGTVTSVERAKALIIGAVSGVLLLLCSYLLLATIDPTLVNLSPPKLITYDIARLTQSYDLPPSLTQGRTADQVNSIISSAKISGSGGAACSITNCGSQTVQGNTLSTGAATKYDATKTQIENTLNSQGLNGSIQITSTVTGEHSSSCHNASSANGGTCADFVIYANGQNIKNLSQATQQQYIQAVAQALNGSSNVTSCLNEYQISTTYSTGGHFHCNF